MTFRTAIAGLALLAAGLVPAGAAELFDHNGSTMRLERDRREVRILYERPRPGLEGSGVRVGTLLFEGLLEAGYLEGMTRIFSRACGEIDYFVYGDYAPGQVLVLQGAAPVLSEEGCRTVDNVYDGPNARLVFTPVSTTVQPEAARLNTEPRSPFGYARLCVTGVRSTLNLRAGPGSDYGAVAELPADACGVVSMNQCEGVWCVVQDATDGDSVLGWASSDYLRVAQ